MTYPELTLLGPEHRLVARGRRAVLPATSGALAPAHVRQLLREHDLVVGALPFDPAHPAALVVPETVTWDVPRATGVPTEADVPPVPADPDYVAAVHAALRGIDAGLITKIVLARTLDLEADVDVDVDAVVAELDRRTSRGYAFGADVDDGHLLGSSPELLVSVRDGVLRSQPMAGSTPRREDPDEDLAARDRLLASAKDLAEHRLVVDAMRTALAPHVVRLDVPEHPDVVATPHLWHLATTITGQVRSGVTSLDLASALHPTPAVGGVPTARAVDLVRILEPVERGFYSGLVGWVDARGDGEWVIALRCGLVRGRTVRAYAGAGVVAGSTATAEQAETAVKLRTFLSALGVVPGLRPVDVVPGLRAARDADLAGVGA